MMLRNNREMEGGIQGIWTGQSEIEEAVLAFHHSR